MHVSAREKKLFQCLVCKSIDGTITPDEIGTFNTLLSGYPELEQYYINYVQLIYLLPEAQIPSKRDLPLEPLISSQDLEALGKLESDAPVLETPKQELRQELIQKVVYPPREKRKVSKFGAVFLVMNAAAILFFFLFVRFAPPRGGIEVATLTDSINAKWVDADIPMQCGTRLCTGKTPFLLREGLAELKFDNNARITIEGPAEFQILDDDMIKLNYGQLYSHVPSEAYGFQVCTKHAKIIDLGTEFGVKEGLDGLTEVHVLSGEVNLISSVAGTKINVDLLAGSARELNTETGKLRTISCKDHLFVRQIESERNIVWRGQKTLDLADLVGGGNGLGTGLPGSGIDAASGVYTTTPTRVGFPRVPCHYNPVKSNPFIDGVFVPDGAEQPVILNSNGDCYADFPVTDGIYRSPITHGPAIRDRQRFPSRYTKESVEFYLLELQMGGVLYGTDANPAIYMHTNAGITFDLDALRSAYKNHAITQFESICGIPEKVRQLYVSKVKNSEESMLALYIFLDGQCQLVKIFNHASEPERIRIPIKMESRFLTLAVVDTGLDSDYDWCLLGRPVLKFE
jgi:hypothetical protein